MSWLWLGVAAAAPTIAAFVLAAPFWLTRHVMMGNIIGSGVILFGSVLLICREYLALAALRASRTPLRISPDDFTRYAIYAGIGFAEVFLLFTVSLWVDEAMRRRTRAKAWR